MNSGDIVLWHFPGDPAIIRVLAIDELRPDESSNDVLVEFLHDTSTDSKGDQLWWYGVKKEDYSTLSELDRIILGY